MVKGIKIKKTVPSIPDIMKCFDSSLSFGGAIFLDCPMYDSAREFEEKDLKKEEQHSSFLNDWWVWDHWLVEKYALEINQEPQIAYFFERDPDEFPSEITEYKWSWCYHNWDSSFVEIFSKNEKILNSIRGKYETEEIMYPGHIDAEGVV